MDEKARYTIFRSQNGRCHHCGTRLQWDAFEVAGLSGGWVMETSAKDSGEEDGQAYCYKCHKFEGRDTSARRLVIKE